jgi:hypothetical protein
MVMRWSPLSSYKWPWLCWIFMVGELVNISLSGLQLVVEI